MQTIIIGKGLLEMAPIITTISNSVKSIFSLAHEIPKAEPSMSTDMAEFIDSSDIIAKLGAFALLISEIPAIKSHSIANALIDVKNSIVEIEDKLREIKKKMEYNNNLWILKGLRSHQLCKEIICFDRLIKKLDSRIHTMKTIIQISQYYSDTNLFDLSDVVNKPNLLAHEIRDLDKL